MLQSPELGGAQGDAVGVVEGHDELLVPLAPVLDERNVDRCQGGQALRGPAADGRTEG